MTNNNNPLEKVLAKFHDDLAEKVLIAAAVSGPEAITQTRDELSWRDFYFEEHQKIWQAFEHTHDAGSKDPTVDALMKLPNELKDVAFGYMDQSHREILLVATPKQAAKIVSDLAMKRRLARTLHGFAIHPEYDGSETDVAKLVGQIDIAIEKATSQKQQTRVTALGSAAKSAIQTSRDVMAQGQLPGVTCALIKDLKDAIGPLRPGNVTIVAARPGMGKTAFASSFSLGAARNGHGVLFVSLEMTAEELGERQIVDIAHTTDNRIHYTRLKRGELRDQELDRLDKAAEHIASWPMAIVDQGISTIGQLRAVVRRQKRQFAANGEKLELLVVDYLQLLYSDNRLDSGYERVSEVSRGLKSIAMQEDIAVMACAQLSREVEKRTDKRPILSDLRDSGQIEQDASHVVFLYRPLYYLEQSEPSDHEKRERWQAACDAAKDKLEIIVAKYRGGRTGNYHIKYFLNTQAVRGSDYL